ncbi:hypothetical protein BH11ARM2_BH11ARM2_09650 [soil metagenome]
MSSRRGFPLFGSTVDGAMGSLGLLVIRLVFGFGILEHGLQKIQNPFHWGDKAGLPPLLQFLATLSEFGGGLALICGLCTRLGMFGLLITMLVAILKGNAGNPFVSLTGGKSFESAALYAAVAAGLLLAGPGRLSLDWKLFGDRD